MNFFHTLSKHFQLNIRGYILFPFCLLFGYLTIYFTVLTVAINTTLTRNEARNQDFTNWISNLGGRVGWCINIVFALACFVVFAYFAANIGIVFYRSKKNYTSQGAARFIQKLKELEAANLTGPGEIRLWLGQMDGKGKKPMKIGLNYQQQQGNVLLIGDTYASTREIIAPAIAASETGLRSFCVVDTDGMLQKQGEHLRNWYQWHVIDFHQPAFYYNPLGYISSVEDAKNFSLCWIANTEGENNHLSGMHLLLIATVIHLVQTGPTPPLQRLAEVLATPLPALRQLLWQSASTDAKNVAGIFFNTHQEPEAATILAELNTRFLLLIEKTIQHLTAQNTLHFSALGEQPCALVLNLHQTDGKKYTPLTACLLMQLAQVITKRQRQFPFAFYLPMVTHVGYVPYLADALRAETTAFIMGIDQYSQLRTVYGEEDARDIREQVATHVVFRGTKDGKFYSAMCGIATVLKPSTRPDRRSFWRRMIEGPYMVERPTPLLRAEEIQFLPADERLIVRRDTPPVMAKKLTE